MEIDGCPVCEPVRRLAEAFIARKFHITVQRVEDPHFRQVFIQLAGPRTEDLPEATGTVHVENKFICDCHWSTLEYGFDH